MKSIPRAKAVVLFLSLRADFCVHAHMHTHSCKKQRVKWVKIKCRHPEVVSMS